MTLLALALFSMLAALGAAPTAVAAPSCSPHNVPPAAVDTSEAVGPGGTAPAPLPVPEQPVGGARLGSCDFVVPDGAAPPPSDISARAWLVADLTTGDVLGGRDVHGRYRPASTLKLLTLLTAWQRLDSFDQTVIGTDADARQDGSKVGLGEGGVYTIRDLVLGIMLNSGNDCAYALATAMGGYDQTVLAMNSTASVLGAHDTRAATVSGLDGPGQQTSAYDLALIMRADLSLPEFPALLATTSAPFPDFATHPAYSITNDNRLLTEYDGALGGKTGFTDDAGNTFVGVAERDGHRLVVTMLAGTQRPRRQWQQAASLLDWGFEVRAAGLPTVGNLLPIPPVLSESIRLGNTGTGSRAPVAVASTFVSTTGDATSAAREASTSSSSSFRAWLIVAAIAIALGVALVLALMSQTRHRRRRAAAAAARRERAERHREELARRASLRSDAT